MIEHHAHGDLQTGQDLKSTDTNLSEDDTETLIHQLAEKPLLTPRLFALIIPDGSSRLYTLKIHQVVFVTMDIPNCSIIAMSYSIMMMIIIIFNVIMLTIATEPQFRYS